MGDIDEGPVEARASASRKQNVAEPEPSRLPARRHQPAKSERLTVLNHLRRMDTGGTSRLAARHKVALATVTLGTFLILAAFVYGYIDQMGSWGYLGAFLISFLTSATIILPAPGAAVVFVMAEKLNPLLLGLASGLGGGLGAITAYAAGAAGRNAIRRRRIYAWMSRLFRSRWGPFLLFSFTLIPFLPMDLVSAMAGAVRYSMTKYLFYVTMASIAKMTLIALAGAFATGWLLSQFQGLVGAAPKGA